MFVYSCSIKMCVSGFDKFLESIFLHPAGYRSIFPCKKLSRCLKTSLTNLSNLVRGQVDMADEAELLSSIRSTFEALVCGVQSGFVVEKNWALSVDQCWLQGLQFSSHFLSILL